MPEYEIRKLEERRRLNVALTGVPDTGRIRDSNKIYVPQLAKIEYVRVNSGPWSCCSLQVVGKPRLRAGGVGNNTVIEHVRHYSSLADFPWPLWPKWLKELVDRYTPGHGH